MKAAHIWSLLAGIQFVALPLYWQVPVPLLIAILIFAGLATFYLGLAITAPLVGHATWHAYRAVVAPITSSPSPAAIG